jgi:hypothetical protein
MGQRVVIQIALDHYYMSCLYGCISECIIYNYVAVCGDMLDKLPSDTVRHLNVRGLRHIT